MMGWPLARANTLGVVEQGGALDDVDGLGAVDRDVDGPGDDFVILAAPDWGPLADMARFDFFQLHKRRCSI